VQERSAELCGHDTEERVDVPQAARDDVPDASEVELRVAVHEEVAEPSHRGASLGELAVDDALLGQGVEQARQGGGPMCRAVGEEVRRQVDSELDRLLEGEGDAVLLPRLATNRSRPTSSAKWRTSAR
jgi:hypothetical protein